MTPGTQAHVHCSQLNTLITNTYPEVPGVGRGDTDGEDMAPNLDKHRVETLKFGVRSARIELSGDPEEGHLHLGCPEEGHFRAGMCSVLGTDQENNGTAILGEQEGGQEGGTPEAAKWSRWPRVPGVFQGWAVTQLREGGAL